VQVETVNEGTAGCGVSDAGGWRAAVQSVWCRDGLQVRAVVVEEVQVSGSSPINSAAAPWIAWQLRIEYSATSEGRTG